MPHNAKRSVRAIQPAPTAAHVPTQAGPLPVKVLMAILATIVLVISGTGYAFVGRLGGDLTSATDLDLGDGSPKNEKNDQFLDGALDILMVGSDSRTDAQGNTLSDAELAALHAGVDGGEENTDTIMVIRIPKDGSRATAISIPRDTYVHDDDYGNMKINGVYATHAVAMREEMVGDNDTAQAAGEPLPHTPQDIELAAVSAGRAALLHEVKKLTGIDIDHYAEIGLVGFVLLTDAVGGVEVCLNNPVDEPMSGANFPAGRQTLNGAQGLAYVRQRHDLPRGDLDRIVRQQSYAASLVNKLLSSGTLTNPSKLNRITRAVERSVVLDDNWDVMKLATQLSGLAGGNVKFATIPVTSIDGVGDYGESIVTVDPDEVHRFFIDLAQTQEQLDDSQAPAPEEQGPAFTVHVLNAGPVEGMASQVAGWLTDNGYAITHTGNAEPGIYTNAQVVARNVEDPEVIDLAQKLGGLPITANDNLDDTTVIVVTALDYAGPLGEQLPAPAGGEDTVGTPGQELGEAEVSPEIDAGGSGPRCVN